MKGIVFTEFLERIGRKFGIETMDLIIEASGLPANGAYTATGTYSHTELLTLATNLSQAVRIPVSDLLKDYGAYLLARFSVRYPQFFAGVVSSFDFLDRVEDIHAEMKTVYPDAELPSIRVDWLSEDRIHLIYSSPRPLAAFAEGLMRGAVAYFEERIEIRALDAADDGTFARFELTRS